MEPERMKGVVKWFNSGKGYGFIKPENGDIDIFLHYSGIRGDGYKTIQEGAKVEFDVERTDRGPQARDVVKI